MASEPSAFQKLEFKSQHEIMDTEKGNNNIIQVMETCRAVSLRSRFYGGLGGEIKRYVVTIY